MPDSFKEYRGELQLIVLAASLIREIDFASRIASIDRADVLGPLIDPTLYRDKSHVMHIDRELFVAAHGFLAAVKKVTAGDSNA